MKLVIWMTAIFWFDNWTSYAALVDLILDRGLLITGVPINTVVRDALVRGKWCCDVSRSRSPAIQLWRQYLPSHKYTIAYEVDDRYCWKIGNSPPSESFSSSAMWTILHDIDFVVDWLMEVWFSSMVPKYAFLLWIMLVTAYQPRIE